jgi:hypothetical protein
MATLNIASLVVSWYRIRLNNRRNFQTVKSLHEAYSLCDAEKEASYEDGMRLINTTIQKEFKQLYKDGWAACYKTYRLDHPCSRAHWN